MIVGSVVLIAVAAALLIGGFARHVDQLYYGSIVTSALAAFTLIVGARQVVGGPADHEDDFDLGPPAADLPLVPALPGGEPPAANRASAQTPTTAQTHLTAQTHMTARAHMTAQAHMTARAPITPRTPAAGQSPTTGQSSTRVSASAPAVPVRMAARGAGVGPVGLRPRGPAEAEEADEGDPPDEPPDQIVGAVDAALLARLPALVFVIDGRPRYHVSQCLHLLGRDREPLPVREAVELGFTPCAQCEPARVLVAQARRR